MSRQPKATRAAGVGGLLAVLAAGAVLLGADSAGKRAAPFPGEIVQITNDAAERVSADVAGDTLYTLKNVLTSLNCPRLAARNRYERNVEPPRNSVASVIIDGVEYELDRCNILSARGSSRGLIYTVPRGSTDNERRYFARTYVHDFQEQEIPRVSIHRWGDDCDAWGDLTASVTGGGYGDIVITDGSQRNVHRIPQSTKRGEHRGGLRFERNLSWFEITPDGFIELKAYVWDQNITNGDVRTLTRCDVPQPDGSFASVCEHDISGRWCAWYQVVSQAQHDARGQPVNTIIRGDIYFCDLRTGERYALSIPNPPQYDGASDAHHLHLGVSDVKGAPVAVWRQDGIVYAAQMRGHPTRLAPVRGVQPMSALSGSASLH